MHIVQIQFIAIYLYILFSRASEQLIEMEEERKILSKQTKEKDAKLQGNIYLLTARHGLKAITTESLAFIEIPNVVCLTLFSK